MIRGRCQKGNLLFCRCFGDSKNEPKHLQGIKARDDSCYIAKKFVEFIVFLDTSLPRASLNIERGSCLLSLGRGVIVLWSFVCNEHVIGNSFRSERQQKGFPRQKRLITKALRAFCSAYPHRSPYFARFSHIHLVNYTHVIYKTHHLFTPFTQPP